MLYAKINPVASFPSQSATPFEANKSNVEAAHITAIARPYQPGASKTRFEVSYGNIVEEHGYPYFKRVEGVHAFTTLELTSDQLANWGTNDDSLLAIVAQAIGTTAIEFVHIPDDMGARAPQARNA